MVIYCASTHKGLTRPLSAMDFISLVMKRAHNCLLEWQIYALLIASYVAGVFYLNVESLIFRTGMAISLEYSFLVLSLASLLMITEMFASLPSSPKKKLVGENARPLPRSSIIVCAYLPNEAGILIPSIEHLVETIERPQEGIEIIIAYNTPYEMALERELEELSCRHAELKLFRVKESQSKAENLNFALTRATGEMVAIFDADHMPSGDCLKKAWHWLENGYDMVQGRNIIRNVNDNIITRLVGIEFDLIYAALHQSRYRLLTTAIFAGSNGYWKKRSLQELSFSNKTMTEDLDITLQAVLSGFKMAHDRTILSYELAPSRITDLWHQRKRWARGWLQVTIRYQLSLLRSTSLDFRQKAAWSILLSWREKCKILTILFFPFLVFSHASDKFGPEGDYAIFDLGLIVFLAMVFVSVCVSRTHQKMAIHWTAYALAAFLSVPYVLFQNCISVAAMIDQVAGKHRWVVTPRPSVPQFR